MCICIHIHTQTKLPKMDTSKASEYSGFAKQNQSSQYCDRQILPSPGSFRHITFNVSAMNSEAEVQNWIQKITYAAEHLNKLESIRLCTSFCPFSEIEEYRFEELSKLMENLNESNNIKFIFSFSDAPSKTKFDYELWFDGNGFGLD